MRDARSRRRCRRMSNLSFDGANPSGYLSPTRANSSRTEVFSAFIRIDRDCLSVRNVRKTVPRRCAMAGDYAGLPAMRSAARHGDIVCGPGDFIENDERISSAPATVDRRRSGVPHRTRARRGKSRGTEGRRMRTVPWLDSTGMVWGQNTQHIVGSGCLTPIGCGVNAVRDP